MKKFLAGCILCITIFAQRGHAQEPLNTAQTPVLFNTVLDSVIRLVETNSPIPEEITQTMTRIIRESSGGMLEVYLKKKDDILFQQGRNITIRVAGYNEHKDRLIGPFLVFRVFAKIKNEDSVVGEDGLEKEKPIRKYFFDIEMGKVTTDPPF